MIKHTRLKQLRLTLFLTIIGAFICACSQQPRMTPIPAGSTVIAFGDSLTYGHGATPKQSYPAVLKSLTGLNVINAGISGETTSQGLQRLPKLVKSLKPSLVILMEGGNDMLQNKSPQDIQANLEKMVAIIQQNNAQVLLIAMPEFNPKMKVPEFYYNVAKKYNIPLDARSIPKLLKNAKMRSDRLHFNEAGYKQLAYNISDLLQLAGAVTPVTLIPVTTGADKTKSTTKSTTTTNSGDKN